MKPRWPVIALASSALIGVAVLIVVLVLLLSAVGKLSSVQAFDHAQSAAQLKQAAAGAKIIPQAISTLEKHLDRTLGRDVHAGVQRIIRTR